MKLKQIAHLFLAPLLAVATAAEVKINDLAVQGGIADGKAKLTIEGTFGGLPGDSEKLIFSTTLQHWIRVNHDMVRHNMEATFRILQGELKEIPR